MRIAAILVAAILVLAACGSPRPVSERWPDGTPRRAGMLKGPKQMGSWIYNHPGGAKAAEGSFSGSMQEGPWTLWHPNGAIAAQGAYAAGLRIGHWRYLRPDGSLQAQGSYRADRQEGLWVSYHPDGRTPSATAFYHRGIWHGPYATFAVDGTRVEAGVMLAGVRAAWLAAGEAASSGDPATATPDAPLAVRRADGVTVLGLGGSRLWIGADGRLALAGDPPAPEELRAVAGAPPEIVPLPAAPPEAAPVHAWHSMSFTIDAAELPPPLPAPVADPTLPPAAAELSPIATLPGWWTADQEAGAASLLRRYAAGQPQGTDEYGGASADVSRARPAWHGRPLPQTRFLGSDGRVIDLAAWKGRRVVVVVMRGFSGQVCIYCAAQTAALAEAAADLRSQDVETLVVYPGPPAAVPAFLQAVASLRGSPPPLPVALDAGLTLVRGLEIAGNLSLPATFILDRDGVVRWTYVGTSIADRPSVQDIRGALGGLR